MGKKMAKAKKKNNKKIMGNNGESSSSEKGKEKEKIMGNNGESSSSEKGKGKGKEKEKIMVHTINVEKGGFVYGEFFTINLSNGEIEELPYILVGGDHGLNAMVSIGSIVYVIGGLTRADGIKAATKPPDSRSSNKKEELYHHGMSFIDLNASDSGWKPAPCYRNAPLYYSTAVTLGGKIYSFSRDDYACIFDPVAQKWKKLLPPSDVGSFEITSLTEVIADPDNNRLLVFFRDPIGRYFAYYPDEKRWEPQDVNSLPWSSRHILLADDGLFFIYLPKDPNVFKVYDSVAHQWLNVEFTSKVPYSVWRSKFQAMVYLGNDLICLLAHFPIQGEKNITTVTVCKFKFFRCSPTELLFTWFTVNTYPLNSACMTIPSYLPI